MESLTERVSGLSADKRELLEALLRKKRAQSAAAAAIRPRSSEGPAALSFSQERLWLIDQLEPGNPAYNMPFALRLTGMLTPALLERVFAEIVRRHEALRTTFAVHAGQPVQVIDPGPLSLALPVVDLAHLPAAEREAAALRLAREMARQPFDLQKGPLLRLALLRLGVRDHFLLVNLHHIISDGWSLGVLQREVSLLYEAFALGRPSPLPGLPVQYADFALWQRSRLQGEELERQLAFWRRRLAGAPPVLELPTDRPRPAVQSFRGALRTAALPPALSESLRELCRRKDATPFMALLAAWAVLLGRHASQEDVVVGTPVAGRSHQELEGLIGFFVNTLALRIGMDGGLTFEGLLTVVREDVLEAFSHQDLPFERLVGELATDRSLAHAPLFQVLFALQNAPGGELTVQGLRIAPVPLDSGMAKFDLTLTLAEGPSGLAGTLEYSTDLFDASTAERLLARFEILLDGALAHPDIPLPELPLLLAAERQQLLAEWNDTESAFPREACLPELFEEVAREMPEAPAVVTPEGDIWSYRRLDETSSRLARRLRALGVGPETAVGLCMDRSAELIAGTLAILKAGGVYVPLDAGYPDERLAFLLQDTGARIVLVHAPTRERVVGLAQVVAVDDEDWMLEDASPLGTRVPAESLAYVIYTSGSTGRPKGVAVPHRAVVRLVRETDYVRLGPGQRTGHVANISFDAATYEIWGALLTGAAVVVIPRDLVLSPADFARWIEERGVTSMFLTSALFTRMSREAPEAFAGMSELLVGGEAVDPAAARTVLAGRPPRRLLNGYGPTESTTFAAWHTIRAVSEGAAGVPIGSPLANTTLYVLDRSHTAMPPGSAGELCIGGDGLARGYLNRPELTAERFLPHPWQDGGRLYRTGDLVRQRADGVLEYLGRLDHQVKIRGFRIEPGEIEAVLAGHPGVRECAVLARRDSPGDARLVAYVAGPETPEALRSWLAARLPDFMLPSAFVTLDALPLTPNGKLDRRALPAPELAASTDAEAPSDPVEELLAGIWAEVLGLPRVGVRDDFFALGGHSLLATQVMSRLREVLGVELPLRTLFEAPTVAELARLVREGRQEQPSPPIVPAARNGDLPLSFAQQRLWLLDQLEPGSPAYNVPLALRLTGEVDPARLERIFAEIVRRHEVLRTTFDARQDRPVQVISPELRPGLPVVDLSHLPAAEREPWARRLALEEARRPFDLRRGPLLRLALIRLDDHGHLLLVTLHHIVSDGWSLGVLLREIAALSEGHALPELPVQYADFAVWQQAWLQGEVLESQLGYWKRQLAGAPRLLELPLDRPRPAVQTYNGAQQAVTLSPDLSEAVRRLCRQQGVTPFMALLAAWAVLLGRHAGQDDVLTGSPIAGRNRREIEGLIGFFVNTLVLRTDFSGSPSFRELLVRVRQTALDGYAHQDLPFERIVEEVVSERDLAVSPLFQVLFALQNAPVGELALPGLALTPVALDGGVAKFDLSLSLGETPSGFAGALEHNTDLFDAGTAERLWARFLALLEAAAGDPATPVADLPLLLPVERAQLLAWNETGEIPPFGLRLHELFAAQAVRTPYATAVIHGEERLTYAELAGRAGGIARHLRGLGVGPEVRVAVCLERSPDLIAALLGVLAAGGAYVPVDPAYPEDRRAFMVEDSGAALLLTRVKDIPPADLPAGGMKPGHLAYLIYTSGSTGRPKGVAIEHRSAVALVEWARESFSDEELSGVLAATSVCFDLSVFEIFVPLAFGGTIVLAENALALPGLPTAGAVRLLNTVPSAAAELVRSGGIPASVRTVCLAGEPLPAALAQRLHATGTVRRVLNLYGPSEDTTYSTGALVSRDDPRAPAIGQPVRGTRAWVVDRHGALVPPGVAGELWLAGAGLARGYLGRPELTAERFTPDPFGGPGERVYRTGDLVRRRTDGELEFLGRIDHQVKVRGFRIELGEIEAALASHPSVREGAVVAREDVLVAYVASSGEAPDAGTLRAFLGQRLPEFMIPSSFVVLDALPLSPNGKVDRKALPAPNRTRGRRENVAPRTKTEEILAAIWKELLGLDQVGVEDRFFELGGHSLLATQVLSRVRQAFGVDLPLREIFRHPTVAGLAELIDAQAPPVAARAAGLSPAKKELLEALLRKKRAETQATANIGRRSTADGPVAVSFAQERLWVIDQLEPGTPAYNMPLAVRLTGEVEPTLLARIFEEIVRRHEALRTTFTVHDGQPAQEIAGELRLALPLLDLSGLAEAERDAQAHRLAREEAGRGFDLQRGPLLRVNLVRLGVREHLLLVTMHHIVSDGWSLGVLLRELGALYEAFSRGLPSPLPELPVQYADFAAWQRGWLQGEVLEKQLAFWKDRLAGAPHVLELPTDRPRPAVQSFRGASQPLALPLPLAESLRELGHRADATPFMVLLSAWVVLLGRHAGQDDLLVGTPIAGRNRWEIEGLIGVFVNTLVLRAELGEGLSGIGPTFLEVLGRVRSMALDAFAHQELPFERLVEELAPERDLARSPLFQTLFVLQNTPGGALRLPGLSLAQVETPVSTAKLDLTLSLVETSQGVAGALEYATDLFDASTIQGLLGHFGNLLASVAADPDGPLSELRLMDAAEKRLLTAGLNRGERGDPERSHSQVRDCAPRTKTEETLAEIWREVLGLDRVGVEERFFEIGGHSLLATRVLSRVRQTFGVEIPLREIFQRPTIAGLAERIEAQAPVSATKAGTGRRLDGPLPLSFSQERLWLIDQLEPGTPAYNIPLTVRLRGEIAPPLLARIFAEIVRRHETLRTTFAVHAGAPVQVIAPSSPPSLPILDLAGLPDACREGEALRLAREEVRRSFDLGRGPLLRLTLVRLGEREHLLLATLHHIISDGWSMGVLLREVQILYAAFARGLPSPLPELSLQYADFALRQRSRLQGAVLAAQLDWWRRELADAPGVLSLPLDRPRAPLQSRESALLTFALPAGLTARLQELARREGLTTFMVLLAAFQALLHRLGGQDDVLVGTPVANRRQLETEGLIGFFVNTLVLRAKTFSLTFGGLLERTRETVLDAFEHQDAPFERLVEELVPDRNLSVAPLFQVSFSLQTASRAPVSLPGLTLEALPIHSGKAQFDLSLDLFETGGGLQGSLEISRALFDRTTGRRMVEAFVHLLQSAVATPELQVAGFPLLDEAGRHQVLHEWNGNEALPDRYGSILPLFERRAVLAPDAPAVSLGGQEDHRRLTYGELDRRADRLAHRLRRLGVGPEKPVAVVAERTPELIVAFLGILKAGGAYVPLDPAYPEERRALMLEDSRALLLGPEMMEDDPHPRPLSQGRGEHSEGQLAYVLYTSGSTGRPKGVMVSHGALARYVEAVRTLYGIGPGDRVLQFCSTSFDTSLEEIVPCLTAGAELVLRTDAMLGPVAVFLESCRAQGITVLSLPTAYWHEIAAKLESENLALPSCLRLVILGGERALPAWVETWRRLAPERPRLLNTYGLTEATIVSTATDLTAPPSAETRGEVSIGRAIRGTEVLLLDRENSPVPIGAPGELLIGGGLLARGYLGRPDLTAERFVPHPFASEPGARLYRTGDLARWRPGGDLEFAGRGDRQVKIRGYRIEIAEIEARLLSHPEVASAVAVVREDQPGEKRIAAYIVPRHEPGPAPAVLRAHLRAVLPDYMVPGAWVTLSALPLTPNGKVDRRALPAPDPARREEREVVAPRTRTEETLADIWKELLGLDQVGIEDRFFELGGHSLLATRVLSRIRQAFGIDLPLREIFQHPTIAGLAERIDEQALAAAASIRRRSADGGPLPLSFSQERLWLIDQLDPGTPAYNMPLAVRLTGDIAPALLARIFAEIVRRHEALRTTFEARDGQPFQVIHEGPPPVLPLIDLSCLPDREAQALRLAREEARRSFDLQRGPLLRLALLRLGAREHVLLVTLHHIVSDGWSMDLLLREIQVLAVAFAQGLPSPLAELPVQYADFALWQRSHLQGEVLAAQLGWWRRELTGAPGVLALPLDRPRSPLQSSAGEILPFVLPTGPAARLQELARREGLSSFMVLLAAFQTLLHRLGGQDDVLVGTPVANRRLLETESLIGFFVNTLVLRGRPGSAPTFQGLLEQTRETVLGAFEHQDAPFERLVEELVPDRDLSVAPLFQAVFNLQAAAGGAPAPLPGLTLEALPVHSGKAQFELSLDLLEAGGEISGSLEISRALFDRTTGQRMLESFVHLLRAAVETPDLRIAEIPLLDEAQRHQLLREWGQGGVPTAEDGSILPLFERRAAERPDAPAVSLGGQAGRQLTYGELDRRANRLAHRLRGLGVGPEAPVAVLAERTPELIVAFLGILKAGGAYVPIDPAYPEERRSYMLEDSRALLLTPELLEDRCSPLSLGRGAGGEGHQLAYVLYTSGSTGRPKGVMGSHGALARYVEMVRPVYGIGPGDRVLQFCSTSFDTSLEEIVTCLTAGAELVLRTDAMLGSVATFLDACGAQGVTVLSLPTAYWHEIAAKVEAEGLTLPPSLRLVILGGERALVARVAAWRRSAPEHPRLLNSYGVTESTIVSTATDLAVPSASEARGEVSIGRALRGTEILLLDRELEPAPIGTAGELLIGGALLARGYLGRLDLTAERFVPHPFPPEPGARLYRTGDLARMLPDGALEFIGRGDRQVKIRGYRIETGEIEARLLLHPEVESAVVVVREDRPGEKLIAAYLVPRSASGQAGPAPAALRAFVRETLPDYMVPSAFVLLAALPLSPNGKVDRKALPVPERPRDTEHLGPRDALELQLVQIWEEVLNVRPVGVRDDFFALGGHSLLAVQLTARIQSRLGRSLALASLLRHPTVERLAALLRQEGGPVHRTPAVELAPGHGTPLFLVHPVGGEVLCYVPLARLLGRPVHGLQAGEEELSLEEMAALYLRHVREAQPDGPYLLGGWSLGGAVAYEMARQLEAAGATVDRVVLIDSYAPGGIWHEEVPEAALVASFAADLARLLGIGGVALPEDFGGRGRADALGWLGARAEEAGLLPPGFGAAELERRFTTFAANHRAMAGYQGGPCAAPLLLLRAAEPASGEADHGWERVAGRPVEVHELPGDHYTLLQEPAVERLAAFVRELGA